MKQQFNMDEALELVKQGARIDGKDGVLRAPNIRGLWRFKKSPFKATPVYENEHMYSKRS